MSETNLLPDETPARRLARTLLEHFEPHVFQQRPERLTGLAKLINATCKLDAMVEHVRACESLLGTETTRTFADNIMTDGRLNLLRNLRSDLRQNGQTVENLSGKWHTVD